MGYFLCEYIYKVFTLYSVLYNNNYNIAKWPLHTNYCRLCVYLNFYIDDLYYMII